MVSTVANLQETFQALADPSRLAVVERLSAGPQRAGELAEASGLSAPAMSKHLRVLLQAGIVRDERSPHDARVRVFRLRPESVVGLRAWLDQLQAQWDEQLGAFKRHLDEREQS
jgi:DNA-binding transcriptional ArsR family regulator